MTKRLSLRRETISDLTTAELEAIAAGGAPTSPCHNLTIGGSCGIVCHTAGLGCFTDGCTTR